MDAEALRQSGIYTITNLVTGRVYVGSAVLLGRRLANHRYMLRRNQHPSVILQSAWNKYGEPTFRFSVVEIVSDKTDLISREQRWIDQLQAFGPHGYNLTPKAGSQLGFKMSDEAKAKMRAAKLGTTRVISPEHREKIGAAHRGVKRGPRSPEHVAAMRRGHARRREMMKRFGGIQLDLRF